MAQIIISRHMLIWIITRVRINKISSLSKIIKIGPKRRMVVEIVLKVKVEILISCGRLSAGLLVWVDRNKKLKSRVMQKVT